MPQIALVVGAVASVAGTVISHKAQKKQARLQQQQQTLSTRRSRMQAIRQGQITRAQSIASAQGAGALGSSATAGGIGSLSSRTGADLGFSTQMSGLSRDISAAGQKGAFGQGLASFGMMGLNFGLKRGARFSDLKPTSPAASGQGAKNFDSSLYQSSAHRDTF